MTDGQAAHAPAFAAAGGMTSYSWEQDPKRLAFQFARYRFVARMLEGKARVLEVGCGDGCGARIVRQHVGAVDAVDNDPNAIRQAGEFVSGRWPVWFLCDDFMRAQIFQNYDAVYSLDLFEHIAPELEDTLLRHLRGCAPVCIIGTPSLESQQYASKVSLAGHVNCVNKAGLRERVLRHWSQAFMFGMNDETLHTGHDGMTHYLFAVCVA